jgi:hypothetical protein
MYLPDDTKLTTATKTLLPFEQMTKAAREAEVLPGLKKSLASVNKWSEEGYTTVFHPGEKGVTVHNPGTLTMTTSKPPVLQGYKPPRGAKLWTVSANHKANKQEQTNNVYSLPLMAQTIKYLHAAAGYPVEDTWIAAINAGNYNTWPGLSAQAVRRHFPELDETQKGNMKKQQQNRCTCWRIFVMPVAHSVIKSWPAVISQYPCRQERCHGSECVRDRF